MERTALGTLIPLDDTRNGRRLKNSRTTANACLERLLAVHRVKGICETVPACSDSYEFARKALDALDVTPVVSDRDLKAVPSSGPAVVIANHPFGGVDG
ncbi:MAG: hypothetical protein JXL84_08760, partial [Deltaproteobacteria bacterium]|nr:hypothetical protein [Deltaproteobacteria bacterium]